MHGRKKLARPLTDEEHAAVEAKVDAFLKLSGKLLEARNQARAAPATVLLEQVEGQALQLQAQLLRVNPDYYTLWGHRKELLLAQLDPSAVQAGAAELPWVQGKLYPQPPAPLEPDVLATELELTSLCIQKQPKSYPAWHHRLWAVKGGGADLDAEIALTAEFLDADERNFHCWAYRMHVAAMAEIPAEAELAFTTDKIAQNFSNYSAFHYRSKLLERIGRETAANGQHPGTLARLREELQMVVQAAFTEPDDQSAWWYHRFLLAWAVRSLMDEEGKSALVEVLEGELEQLQELIDMEPNCKWARLTLADTLSRLIEILPDDAPGKAERTAEWQEVNGQLIELDPTRAAYYRALRDQRSAA